MEKEEDAGGGTVEVPATSTSAQALDATPRSTTEPCKCQMRCDHIFIFNNLLLAYPPSAKSYSCYILYRCQQRDGLDKGILFTIPAIFLLNRLYSLS